MRSHRLVTRGTMSTDVLLNHLLRVNTGNAAAAAAFVVYKGWAKPIARSVAMWVRGDTDANAYIRNRDSARGGSTAPVQAAGLGGSFNEPTMTRMPAGASTYNPPA